MKILINFANEEYLNAQAINTRSAKAGGFDKVISYSVHDIDSDFYCKHKDILMQERGCGLWLWKPYFIYRTLQECDEADIVFYCDSGAFFFRSAQAVFDIVEKNNIWISVLPLIEKQYTKRKAFINLGCSGSRYEDTPQYSASFLAMKKCDYSCSFVKEWLDVCCVRENLEGPSACDEEADYYIGHREDQSLLSLTAKKWGIRGYSDPSQFGRVPEEYLEERSLYDFYDGCDYKPFIIHHRKTNPSRIVLFKEYLYVFLPRKMCFAVVDNAVRIYHRIKAARTSCGE